jgi:hypothetical protein
MTAWGGFRPLLVSRHTPPEGWPQLRVPVEERDSEGKRRMSGGNKTTRGTPQGG